jgi:hypothetical protein
MAGKTPPKLFIICLPWLSYPVSFLSLQILSSIVID